ncbi:peptide-methionine (S)-S-oxide reductase MsrA [Sulfurimonas sp.]|nr:peptide-methionine (S)-S-oxide reductase MsrA [Sulfurimonas sp.]
MKRERLVLGGGCFWCVEGVFSNVKGVESATSGYTGGSRPNPTYESICTGVSGHAEIVDIVYDSEVISRRELLDIFFAIHNPTTLNAQGADKGTQYRSVIYYENNEMLEEITDFIKHIQSDFSDEIVTEVSKIGTVYEAEGYHQNYYKLNPSQGYCQAVIAPKLQKFISKFPQNLA